MAWRFKIPQASASTVLVVAAASLYGSAIPMVVFGLGYLYSIPLVIGTLFPLILYASRNPRLFFLVGMVFTSQLSLSINFRGHQHMGGTHAYSIALMDFFLVPLLVFIARDLYLGRRRAIVVSPISVWWLALIAIGAYAIVAGPYREMALKEVISMLKNWLLFLVIINECVREKHFHYVLIALVANVALNVGIALLQYFLKRDLGLQALGEASAEATLGANFGVYGSLDSVYRVGGLAGHANLLSAYLAMVLPILIGQIYTGYRWSTRALLAVISGVAIIALGMTLSRSGWGSFAVSMAALTVALFALPALQTRYLFLKTSMLATMMGGMVVASGPILRRLFESDSGALDFRFEWIQIAWNMVLDKPYLGFGLNSFIYHLGEYSPYSPAKMNDMFGDVLPAVHNTYMLVWSEMGTIGLAIFLGMHAHILWLAIKNLRYFALSERISMMSLGAACGMLAIMVDGYSSFYVRIHAPARTFWLVVGLIVAIYYWNVRNDALRRGTAPLPARGPDGPESPAPEPDREVAVRT